MPNRLLAAVALAAFAISGPAAAQPRQINPRVQPAQPVVPALRQPSNLELQMEINRLTEAVSTLSDRLAALNQHIASMSGQLGTLNARELNHARRIYATVYETCRLLYQHHWAPNGAHPTPGNPYVPDTYCTAAGWQNELEE